MSADARGRFGFSGGLGAIRLGDTRLGFYSPFAGIYSRKKLRKGWGLSKMLFYRPTNPQTTGQQAWRAVFAAGWVAYAALTPTEKMLYSKHAREYRLSGPQLFMRDYLSSHRL